MVVMISNATGFVAGELYGRYPTRVAHLFSPGGQRGPFCPYALDNGAWSAWQHNLPFDEPAWRKLLAWAQAAEVPPDWALVPDVVADRDRTLELWTPMAAVVRAHGFRPAFALQDGMTFDDVPSDDCILFIGGSTTWKVAAIDPWCRRFPGRVHVARVNNHERLWKCYRAGAVSVDGTGWFRDECRSAKAGGMTQAEVLRDFFNKTATAQRKAA